MFASTCTSREFTLLCETLYTLKRLPVEGPTLFPYCSAPLHVMEKLVTTDRAILLWKLHLIASVNKQEEH